MAINPRNLLLFAMLAGAALMTLMVRLADEAGPPGVDSEPAPGGYYMLGAVVHVTDDRGEPVYRILAERIEPDAEGDDIVLDGLRVEYTPEADVRWDISAARGLADVDLDTLRLLDGVRLVYAAGVDGDEIVIETNELLLQAKDLYASTTEPVTMRKGRSEGSATSLELDLNTDDWRLGSKGSEGPDVTFRTAR